MAFPIVAAAIAKGAQKFQQVYNRQTTTKIHNERQKTIRGINNSQNMNTWDNIFDTYDGMFTDFNRGGGVSASVQLPPSYEEFMNYYNEVDRYLEDENL